MKAILSILVISMLNIIVLTGQVIVSQNDPDRTVKLGTEDLLFNNDSTEMSVISASRSSKRIGDLPITIYVVTREEIIKNHYNSFIDVIKRLPGVRVSQPGSGELGESFQLQGLIGNLYTMILINGLPIKPGAVVGMPILSQLPIRQAERIEVIYGPAAAVYGADKNIMQYSFYGGLSEISDLKIKSGYEDVYNPLHYLQNKGVKHTLGSNTYESIQLNENLLILGGIDHSRQLKVW